MSYLYTSISATVLPPHTLTKYIDKQIISISSFLVSIVNDHPYQFAPFALPFLEMAVQYVVQCPPPISATSAMMIGRLPDKFLINCMGYGRAVIELVESNYCISNMPTLVEAVDAYLKPDIVTTLCQVFIYFSSFSFSFSFSFSLALSFSFSFSPLSLSLSVDTTHISIRY